MEPIIDKIIIDHVSPALCGVLKGQGFNIPSSYIWKILPDTVRLHTNAFDIDGYYESGEDIIDRLSGVLDHIPAWTITEMERYLPDYLIARTNNVYTISIDENYKVGHIEGSRLPDLLASMLIQLLRKRMLDVRKLKAFR